MRLFSKKKYIRVRKRGLFLFCIIICDFSLAKTCMSTATEKGVSWTYDTPFFLNSRNIYLTAIFLPATI